ncbi:MAG: hypothetical protein R2831_10900 [Chitinophagaceae bacterium]
MKNITILLLLLSSCYTPKLASKRVLKAQTKYPAIVANLCAQLYPTKDSFFSHTIYKPGKLETLYTPPIHINCDSFVKEKKTYNNINTKGIVVPCPPHTNTTDTFIDHEYHQYENTAKIEAKEAHIQELSNAIAIATHTAKKRLKTIIILSALITLCLIFFVVKFFI